MGMEQLSLEVSTGEITGGLGLFLLFLSIVFACGAQYTVLRLMNRSTLKQCHEVGGYYFSVVATLYAVLIGLVVFDAQSRFEDSKNNVETEAAAGMMVYILSKSVPGPVGESSRRHFEQYVNRVLDYEWTSMSRGSMDAGARIALEEFSEGLTKFVPASSKDEITLDKIYDNLSLVWQMRRQRLDDMTYKISNLEWTCILLGGATTIFFGFFFALENVALQMVMSSILTLIISLNVYLVYQYGNPYSGEIHIAKTSFLVLQDYMNQGKSVPQDHVNHGK